ncbi:MAG TPA: hypothetical protein VI935_09140 [Thermodesulfobacteriota bacterium]|nr:hypothetical protein [Thermodesulfobacteriota bacterium]
MKSPEARSKVTSFKQTAPLAGASWAWRTVCHCEHIHFIQCKLHEAIPDLDCFVVSLLAMTFPCCNSNDNDIGNPAALYRELSS